MGPTGLCRNLWPVTNFGVDRLPSEPLCRRSQLTTAAEEAEEYTDDEGGLCCAVSRWGAGGGEGVAD